MASICYPMRWLLVVNSHIWTPYSIETLMYCKKNVANQKQIKTNLNSFKLFTRQICQSDIFYVSLVNGGFLILVSHLIKLTIQMTN